MTELGNRLKEARLAKGLSFDDLQTATKIQKRYLVGIEEGNYANMPGDFYVRAFIKQYAEALELDPEEIFASYKNEIPAAYKEDLPEQLSRVRTRTAFSERSSKVIDFLPRVLITILVVGVVALVYYFLQHHAGTNTNEAVNNQNAPVKIEKSQSLDNATVETQKKQNTSTGTSNTTAQNTVQTQAPKQTISQGQISGQNNTAYQVTNAAKFVVKLVARGNSWVSIKNSKGALQYEGVLQAGGTNSTKAVDLSSDTEAVIRIGNAGVTDIYVNDQKIDYAIPANQVTVQNITIQNVPKNK